MGEQSMMSVVPSAHRCLLPLARLLVIAGVALALAPTGAAPVHAPVAPVSSCGGAPGEGRKAIVRAEDVLHALRQEGGEIDCSGLILEGDLQLFTLPAETDPNTGQETIIIQRPLKFRGTEFTGKIGTWDQFKPLKAQPSVTFASDVDLIGARFRDDVNFDGARFQGAADFGGGHFHQMASFTEASFQGYAGFRSTQFDGRALFREVDFGAEADFATATFNWIAFFIEARFRYPKGETGQEIPKRGANFLFTRFKGDALFNRAYFESIALFTGASFHGPAHFSETTFENEAWFIGGATFDNHVTFKAAKFLKERPDAGADHPQRPPVLFSGVMFAGDAIFSAAEFHQVTFAEVWPAADLGKDTIFRGSVDFRRTKFERLDLSRVTFHSGVDFSGADLGATVNVTNIDIERGSLRMRWDQLLDEKKTPKFVWHEAFEEGHSTLPDQHAMARRDFFNFLTALEKNFRQREQFDDAAEVRYLLEDLRSFEGNPWERLLDLLIWKGIYGYGVKPRHQLWASLLFIIGFAFLYVRPNALRSDQTHERRLSLRITDIPVDWAREREGSGDLASETTPQRSMMSRYWRALSFSVYVFTKIGYGGVYARHQYKYVVLAEWL
jgi:uncharacterized protein YjbI with pentapeptide repeats